MCTILLPIKPEYVDRIIDQSKLYEYRKKRCKQKVDKIVIYCTAPVKKIVAEVLVEDLISSSPSQLWGITKQHAGISKSKYMKYFANNDTAFAYKLGKVTKYEKAKTLEEYFNNCKLKFPINECTREIL